MHVVMIFFRVKFDDTIVQTKDLCGSKNTGGWVQGVVNLSSYIGRTKELKFEVKTDDILNSNLFLDDVSFSNIATVSSEVIIPEGANLDLSSQPHQ